jgi:hypothetical protein
MALGLKSVTVTLGYQQITSLSSSTGLTLPQTDAFGNAVKPLLAVITPETQAVRYRDDGIAPTATVGFPLAVGQVLSYDGDLTKLRFIEQTGSAKLNINYYA